MTHTSASPIVRCTSKPRLLALLLCLVAYAAAAQGFDPKPVEQLIADGSYTTAYNRAEAAYANRRLSGHDRLVAAYLMGKAAAYYQEDVYDSTIARYQRLLPQLDGLSRALCHVFLQQYDSAFADPVLLQTTPASRLQPFVVENQGINVSPTAYDVLVWTMLNGSLDDAEKCRWLQRLVDFHRTDSADDVRLYNELMLLQTRYYMPNVYIGWRHYQEVINRYRGSHSPLLASLYSEAASCCNASQDYVRAVAYCDTGYALFPSSEGGVECFNLKAMIEAPQIVVKSPQASVAHPLPGLRTPCRVSYCNVDHLWLRVVRYDESWRQQHSQKKLFKQVLQAKPLHQWDITLPSNSEYRPEEAIFDIPALEVGHYMLLVGTSAEMKEGWFIAGEMDCNDAQLVGFGSGAYLLCDRRTGMPLVGEKVGLFSYSGKQVDSATSNAEGRFAFTNPRGREGMVKIYRNGAYHGWGYSYWTSHTSNIDTAVRCHLFIDRPIYRPTDTLQASLVLFRTERHSGLVLPGAQAAVSLIDPFGQVVRCDTLRADDFGAITIAWPLPADRAAGLYHLQVRCGNRIRSEGAVQVEAYRQPRFVVSLDTKQAEPPAFGREAVVKGAAVAYSGVPLEGARVQYKVVRTTPFSTYHLVWSGGLAVVDTGEAVVKSDGSFLIRFTPEVDSSVSLTPRTFFTYDIDVTVTDLNGESHEAFSTLTVGYNNGVLRLESPSSDCSTLSHLSLSLTDLDRQPTDGMIHLRLTRQRKPSRTLLRHEVLRDPTSAHHLLSRDEWQRRFPLYAYDSTDYSPLYWDEAQLVLDTLCPTRDGLLRLDLPRLAGGIYKVEADADGALPLRTAFCYTPTNARQLQSDTLLWAETDRTTAQVGERVRLRLGSAVPATQVYCLVASADGERLFRRFDCRNGELQTLDIEVDSSMLGNFWIALYTVREGIDISKFIRVEVPYRHKQLDVEISTFRDRLVPGATEQWTLRVRNAEGQGQAARMMLTMYDDALNSFGYGSLPNTTLDPWLRARTPEFSSVAHVYSRFYNTFSGPSLRDYKGWNTTPWRLEADLPYFHMRSPRMYKSASATRGYVQNLVAEEEEDVQYSLVEVEAVQYAPVEEVAAMHVADNGVETDPMQASGDTDASLLEPTNQPLRTNLNPLAFFVSDLRTDASGEASYTFRLPELLTRWQVRGMAYTADLRSGSLVQTLTAAKPLMVQPNMPRFLRQGDSVVLTVKVVKEDTTTISDVELCFLLTNAATADTLCLQTQTLRLKGAARATFEVEVPQGVGVVQYSIVATAPGMSDGERAEVPVLGNRQTVTISRALYINGVGTRRYAMSEWLAPSATRTPLLLAAEAVGNPVWLAVKAMPYMKGLENPSSLYLAERLYVNTLGSQAARRVDFGHGIDTANATSALRRNADLKQTPIAATPLQRAAEAEEEQMRAAAHYLDSAALATERSEALHQLSAMQNADGGWPWMPEGRSSVWVSQQVLKRLAVLPASKEMSREGLRYVDAEVQRDYERYVKPHLKKGYNWQPTNIDYLYMRSLYGKASTEAYKFYYANALKKYKTYNNLYTQAQLALVFHRHGDHRAALDLLRRIKEKALQSDEMGLYWRDNRSGWFWYSRPIETQALLIQAFAEITPKDTATIGLMQQWLLKQKQTTHWGNDRATAEAIRALMVEAGEGSPSQPTTADPQLSLSLFGTSLQSSATGAESYAAQRWTGPALDSVRALQSDSIILRKSTPGIAWAAVYYQFDDDLDQIPAHESGITLRRTYLFNGTPRVGDRVRVRLEFTLDRAMDYLELVDNRPSCTEPVSTRASWHWSNGLAYYCTVNNTDTRLYIEHLDKGHYTAEYDLYITNAGTFMSGLATLQCMYAPEFRAVSPAQRIEVQP